jgi:VRR-NUC domain
MGNEMPSQPPFEVSAELARKMLDATITEDEWRATVKEEAQYNGWQVLLEIPDRAYQVLAKAAKTDRSLIPTMLALRAWPDLLLGHPLQHEYRLVELKTVKGTLTDEQKEKLPLLNQCGLTAEIWRPGDPMVRRILSHDSE